MKKNSFELGMGLFARAFPAKEIDLELCWEMTKDIPEDAYIRSIKRIMAGHKEIFQSTNLIALIRENAVDSTIPNVGDAWAEVLREMARTGSYGQPKFSHPLITQAVQGVGWRSMCMSENIGVDRAHFYRIFDQLKDRAQREEIVPQKLIDNKQLQRLIEQTTERIGSDGVDKRV